MEANPFSYGSPLAPGDSISRPAETQLLLQMALSGQNTRVSAPRRFGKTTLLEDLRAEAERQGLNTLRVDLYGVLSRADVALRLEGAYRNLRGPIQRSLDALLPRTRVKASAGVALAKVEAEVTSGADSVDRYLIDLLDLPVRFFARKAVRTLVVFDEFQDVLQAGDAVDALMRSRIQHQREAASYVFAGSHPGMMDELFGDRDRPLFDQARPVVLPPLGDIATAEYVEERFTRTSRSAGLQLEPLVHMAAGHPQRTMMLAHHLWEHTPAGQHATDDAWRSAVAAVFSDLQEQYERAWSGLARPAERAVLVAVAEGRSPLADSTLRKHALSKSTAGRARERLEHAGDLWREGDKLRVTDPLYAAWIRAGRRSPWSHVARQARPPSIGPDELVPYPFGSPDGARASLGDLARSFVELDDSAAKDARVVVGRNGAGKTLWLRRLAALTANDPSLYRADLDTRMPSTADVIRVTDALRPQDRFDMWSRIWGVAVLRSVVSHLLTAPALRGHVSADQRVALAAEFDGLGSRFDRPVSPTAELSAMLRWDGSPSRLVRYVTRPEWEGTEQTIGEILRQCPPMYFFLDAMDESFAQSPRHWLAVQRGLHLQVMHQVASPSLGPRLHLIITMRDLAYLSMFSTEHATRYLTDRHVHVLRWDPQRLRRLLDAKLATLDSRYLLRPDFGATPEGWLGLHEIRNDVRDTTEDIAEFLTRHTRQLPRDIVGIGNLLCEQTAAAKLRGESALDPEDVRRVVAIATRRFGEEQLFVCAKQIASELMPIGASDWGIDTIYTGEDGRVVTDGQDVRSVADELRGLLQGLSVDRFGAARMSTLRRRIEASSLASADVLSALWQNRLLGYVTDSVMNGEAVFFQQSEEVEMALPLSKAGFVVHPILVDTIGLKPVGQPVVPYA